MPEWDLADRLRKSLRTGAVSSGEMAAYLDVDRSTVTNWMSGRINPRVQSLRLWAMRCGVPFEWLRDGTAPADAAEAVDVRRQGLEPRTR